MWKKICKESSSGTTPQKNSRGWLLLKFLYLTSSVRDANHRTVNVDERNDVLFFISERDTRESTVFISQVYNSFINWTLRLLHSGHFVNICTSRFSRSLSLSCACALVLSCLGLFMFRMHNDRALSPCRFHTIDICDHALSFLFQTCTRSHCSLRHHSLADPKPTWKFLKCE